MRYKTHRNRPDNLSSRDKLVWENVEKELMDHLYKGLSGYFQRKGHEVIYNWSRKFGEKLVLELGCGHGHHLRFGGEYRHYIGLDKSFDLLTTARSRYGKKIMAIQADANDLPIKDNAVDGVVCVYTLEHLKQLNQSLHEVRRVLKNDGSFFVGVPCEGGFCYNIGREFTSKPYMEKKYGIDYDAIIKYEHCNEVQDILPALQNHFTIKRSRWIPAYIPVYHLNIIICLELS